MKVEDENYYRVFPISLGKQLSNKEAHVYLLLLFKSDYNTGESNVLLETLSKEAGYNADTVSGYLHKAKRLGYVDITPQYIKAENGQPKTKNFYKVHIPPKDFIMVSRSFLDLHFDNLTLKEETDIKGFILLVKCICLNNCNLTFYSLREMAKHLKISYATIQKNMKKCIKLKLIEPHKDGYRIMLDCFDKGNTNYFPKGTPPLL
jgi:Mn-dependent DtxR family transcriptional regulator